MPVHPAGVWHGVGPLSLPHTHPKILHRIDTKPVTKNSPVAEKALIRAFSFFCDGNDAVHGPVVGPDLAPVSPGVGLGKKVEGAGRLPKHPACCPSEGCEKGL